jgi:hypothetical protein
MERARAIAMLGVASLLAASALGAGIEPGGGIEESKPSTEAPGPDGWFDARSTHGAFSVRVPAPFVDIHRVGGVQDGEKVNVDVVQVVVQASFGTVQTWQAACVEFLERAPGTEAAFANATDEHASNGHLLWRRRYSFAGHPALDFAVSDGQRSVRSRVIVLGKRVCSAAVNYPVLDPISDADSEKFLASFKPR